MSQRPSVCVCIAAATRSVSAALGKLRRNTVGTSSREEVMPPWFLKTSAFWERKCSGAALFHLCPRSRCLEISPGGDGQLVLPRDSSVTLTCSGARTPAWSFKKDDVPFFQVDPAQNRRPPGGQSHQYRVEETPGSSAMTLLEVSWRHTGVYVCTDNLTLDSREVAVFVPGASAPLGAAAAVGYGV
ncbi:hypothetical protein CRUP_009844 [Coryphaenoides rupestris]|nr:hypothetical protein CRUP_009844 [Coryphaenoides rupestris]